MQKLIVSTLLLCSFMSIAFAGWIPQNPILPGNRWNDVKMIDQNRAIAVGSSGIISRSIDQGSTWETTYNVNRISRSLNAISMASAYEGWVVGDSGVVLYTDDGGLSWERQESNIHGNLFSAFFWDSSIGWAAGDSGIIIHTKDGGGIWYRQESNVDIPIKSLDFVSSSEGWGTGWFDGLLHTDNSGDSWEKVEIVWNESSLSFSDIDFINELTGWISTWDLCMDASCGLIFRTVDGGANWTNLSEESGINPYFSKIRFFNSTDGLALDWWYNGWGGGVGTDIYLTDDGGETWIPYLMLKGEELLAFDFHNREYGLVVGKGGITFSSVDAGFSWERLVNTADLKSVYFINERIGWTAGGNGTVLRTSNGGLDWEIIDTGTSLDLKAIYFTNQDTGWTVGYGGIILKTVDSGNSWTNQSPGSDWSQWSPINSVHFANSNEGWAIGWKRDNTKIYGIILNTTDGGYDWDQQVSTIDIFYNDVSSVDTRHGWVVGYLSQSYPDYYGIINRTIDGGSTWILDTLDFRSRLNAISFIDSLTGWAVGVDLTETPGPPYDGTVLKTVDGGISWFPQLFEKRITPVDVHFIDNHHGWFIDEGGSVFHTDNGGETWSRYTLEDYHRINSVFFVDSLRGWLVGYDGIILKTVDGGVLTTSSRLKSISEDFHLYPNYPNPFNPTTTIEFFIPQSGIVTLQVYDVLGRNVEAILNKHMTAGHHKLNWNASDVPSGIYFVRMQSGNFRQVKKVMVVQ